MFIRSALVGHGIQGKVVGLYRVGNASPTKYTHMTNKLA